MAEQQHTVSGPGGSEQSQAIKQPAIPTSHPPITGIIQLLREVDFNELASIDDTPANRFGYLLTTVILGLSTNHQRQFNQPLPNALLESFLKQVDHYLGNETYTERDLTSLHIILYDELIGAPGLPPRRGRAVYNEDIDTIRDHLTLVRGVLLANDPLLAISLLYTRSIRFDEIAAYEANNEPLDSDEIFGPSNDRNVQPDTRFLILDSSFTPNRFLTSPSRLFDRVIASLAERGIGPGHSSDSNENIPHSILQGVSNVYARANDMGTQDARFTAAINRITRGRGGQKKLTDIYPVLTHYIDIWTRRLDNPDYRHRHLPPPLEEDSINYTRTATPASMLIMLSARIRRIREMLQVAMIAPGGQGLDLPTEFEEFIAQWPANVRLGTGGTLDERSLIIFIAYVGRMGGIGRIGGRPQSTSGSRGPEKGSGQRFLKW